MENEQPKSRGWKEPALIRVLTGTIVGALVGGFGGTLLARIEYNNELAEVRKEIEASENMRQLREESQPTTQDLARMGYHFKLMHTYLIKVGKPVPQDLSDLEKVARTAGINVDSIRAKYNP